MSLVMLSLDAIDRTSEVTMEFVKGNILEKDTTSYNRGHNPVPTYTVKSRVVTKENYFVLY